MLLAQQNDKMSINLICKDNHRSRSSHKPQVLFVEYPSIK